MICAVCETNDSGIGGCLRCETILSKPQTVGHNLNMEQNQTMVEDVNHGSDLMRCLPPEVLSHIFTLCLDPYDLTMAIDSIASMSIRKPYAVPVQFHLGSICQYWRQVAWSTPELWNALHVPITGSIRGNHARNQLLDEWLRRSGQLPLYISVFYSLCGGPLPRQEDTASWDSISVIVETIIRHSCRWKFLDVDLPHFYLPHFSYGSRSAANLESLKIHTSTYHLQQPQCLRSPPGLQVTTPSTARPKYVILRVPRSFEIEALHWSQVIHLQLKEITLHLAIQILHQTPALSSVRLIRLEPDRKATHHPPSNPVTLNDLHTLALHENPQSFLRYILCPHLKILHYRPDYHSNISDILGFLTRSSCSLTALTIMAKRCVDLDGLRNLFRIIPSLTQLNLFLDPGADRPSAEFFKIFESPTTSNEKGADDGAPFIILPNLRDLRLFRCARDFKWPLVKSLINCWQLSSIVMQVNDEDACTPDGTIISTVIDFETVNEVLETIDNGVNIIIIGGGSKDLILSASKFYNLSDGQGERGM